MLKNEYLLAKIGFDTDEDEPSTVCQRLERSIELDQTKELEEQDRRPDRDDDGGRAAAVGGPGRTGQGVTRTRLRTRRRGCEGGALARSCFSGAF